MSSCSLPNIKSCSHHFCPTNKSLGDEPSSYSRITLPVMMSISFLTWCSTYISVQILPWVFQFRSVAEMKHHDQKNTKRRGLVWLTLPGHSPSLRETKTGTWRQKPWRKWLLTHFLTQPRTTCWGVLPPAMRWTLPHQWLTKKMSHRHARRPVCWSISSDQVPSSQVTLVSSWQKLASTAFLNYVNTFKVWGFSASAL